MGNVQSPRPIAVTKSGEGEMRPRTADHAFAARAHRIALLGAPDDTGHRARHTTTPGVARKDATALQAAASQETEGTCKAAVCTSRLCLVIATGVAWGHHGEADSRSVERLGAPW